MSESEGRLLVNNILRFGSARCLVMKQIQFSLIKKTKIGHPEHSLPPTPLRSVTSYFRLKARKYLNRLVQNVFLKFFFFFFFFFEMLYFVISCQQSVISLKNFLNNLFWVFLAFKRQPFVRRNR